MCFLPEKKKKWLMWKKKKSTDFADENPRGPCVLVSWAQFLSRGKMGKHLCFSAQRSGGVGQGQAPWSTVPRPRPPFPFAGFAIINTPVISLFQKRGFLKSSDFRVSVSSKWGLWLQPNVPWPLNQEEDERLLLNQQLPPREDTPFRRSQQGTLRRGRSEPSPPAAPSGVLQCFPPRGRSPPPLSKPAVVLLFGQGH